MQVIFLFKQSLVSVGKYDCEQCSVVSMFVCFLLALAGESKGLWFGLGLQELKNMFSSLLVVACSYSLERSAVQVMFLFKQSLVSCGRYGCELGSVVSMLVCFLIAPAGESERL